MQYNHPHLHHAAKTGWLVPVILNIGTFFWIDFVFSAVRVIIGF